MLPLWGNYMEKVNATTMGKVNATSMGKLIPLWGS